MSERTKPLSSMQGLKRKRIFGHANGDEEEKLVGERERGGKDGKNKEESKLVEYARGPIWKINRS